MVRLRGTAWQRSTPFSWQKDRHSSSMLMQLTGHEPIASSMHSWLPPVGVLTTALLRSESNAKISGHNSTQVSQPIHSSSSILTSCIIHLLTKCVYLFGYTLFIRTARSPYEAISDFFPCRHPSCPRPLVPSPCHHLLPAVHLAK